MFAYTLFTKASGHMVFSRSRASIFRLWVTNQTLAHLLFLWLTAYFAMGFSFGLAYWWIARPIGGSIFASAVSFSDVIYFSFTTLSTVGYGDLTPQGWGKSLSVIEAFFGISSNAIILGIVVFKSLLRSMPLKFADVVYDQTEKYFRFRFINVDEDRLRNVTIVCHAVKKLTLREVKLTNSYYDTITTLIPTELSTWDVVPPFRVMAMKTLRHEEGNIIKPIVPKQNFSEENASPEIFFRGKNIANSFETHFELIGSGYFESTGQQFFFSKTLNLQDIKCGKFFGLSNNELELMSSANIRFDVLNERFNRVESTPENQCLICPFNSDCRFSLKRSIESTRKIGP